MWLALLANAAPLLGLAVWFTPFSFTGGGGWDFGKLFTIGLYMAFVGLVVPMIVWPFAAPGTESAEVRAAIRFHGVVVVIILACSLVAFVNFMIAMTLIFGLGTFVLPFVELARVAIGVRRVLATAEFSKATGATSPVGPSHPFPKDPYDG